jgi:hypothetical protein
LELLPDEYSEIITLEVKGSDAKCIWGIIGIYRATNEGIQVIERLSTRTDSLGMSEKRSTIGGDINLPYADWKGNLAVTRGGQTFINRSVWGNGYSQVVNGATRGDASLDVYLVPPESFVNSCNIE